MFSGILEKKEMYIPGTPSKSRRDCPPSEHILGNGLFDSGQSQLVDLKQTSSITEVAHLIVKKEKTESYQNTTGQGAANEIRVLPAENERYLCHMQEHTSDWW